MGSTNHDDEKNIHRNISSWEIIFRILKIQKRVGFPFGPFFKPFRSPALNFTSPPQLAFSTPTGIFYARAEQFITSPFLSIMERKEKEQTVHEQAYPLAFGPQ